MITGIACVTPLGRVVEQVWNSLLNGKSGIDRISIFDASRFPIQIAAEVAGWNGGMDFSGLLDAGAPRQTQFAVAAGMEVWNTSGLGQANIDRRRSGLSLGCGEIFPDFELLSQCISNSMLEGDFVFEAFLEEYKRLLDNDDEWSLEPGAPLGILAGQLGIEGPTKNYTTACASSSIAIGEALESIRRNETDIMLAGGAHSMIHPLGIGGFHRLSVLSRHDGEPSTAARPFDRTRDGFVVGEGCVLFILEELEHARRRKAKIWAELTGYGSTHDAFRVTDMHPDGKAAARSIKLALNDAGMGPENVGYINAHGSGTPLNDVTETSVIKQSMGQFASRIPISSTKSMTGHLTTACGAIETMVATMAVHDSAIPPTINYHEPDPECDLDYVPNEARSTTCKNALNVNFGFGGNNVALVVSQYS